MDEELSTPGFLGIVKQVTTIKGSWNYRVSENVLYSSIKAGLEDDSDFVKIGDAIYKKDNITCILFY